MCKLNIICLTFWNIIFLSKTQFNDSNIGFVNYHKRLEFYYDLYDNFTLHCDYFTPLHSGYKIQWIKNAEPVIPADNHIDIKNKIIDCPRSLQPFMSCFSSVLYFNYFCHEDVGIYECLLINNTYAGDYVTPPNQLRSVYLKNTHFDIIFNSSTTVCSGSQIHLLCHESPAETNISFVIMKNEKILTSPSYHRYDVCSKEIKSVYGSSEAIFHISNVFPNHSGVYKCYGRKYEIKVKEMTLSVIECSNSYSQTNIILLISMVVLSVVLICIAILACRKRCSNNSSKYELSSLVDRNRYILSIDLRPEKIINLVNEIKLDTLRFIKILGQGEFGQVYLGSVISNSIEISNRVFVAVKIIKYNMRDPLCNLYMEKDLMMQMGKHDNVIGYIGFLEIRDQIAIIMEYASNGSLLNSLLNYHHLPINFNENLLCHFAIDVACGMEHLASINMVHRDLAARNVLITDDWHLKIADFGLTRRVNDYYRQSNENYFTILGSLASMSKEEYLNYLYTEICESKVPMRWLAVESITHKKYSTMSDVWSYGILLWEIFSLGQTPYPDVSDIHILINQIVRGKRNSKPAFCNYRIYDIMVRSWNENPFGRPSFIEINRELNDILPMCSLELIHY